MSDEPGTALVRTSEFASHVPFAYAAVAPPGCRLVFTAGACPLDRDGEITTV